MWQGKPVSEWTEEEKIKFLAILTDAEWIVDFFTIKSFMEKELPEVWDDYLEYISKQVFDDWGQNGSIFDNRLLYTEILNNWLSLDNLIQYLLDNQEWAWIPRPLVLCSVNEDYCASYKEMGCKDGKVKHPALIYAESLKEEL